MTPFAAVAFYPLWAVAMTVLVTVLRLGRQTQRGLLMLCFTLALWVTALILLDGPRTTALAERLVPSGMLMGAGFYHAGGDLFGGVTRRRLLVAYAVAGSIAALGLVAPETLYSAGARAPGPLFAPITVIGGIVTLVDLTWLILAARSASGVERRRRWALAAAGVFGSLGGGGIMVLRVYGLGDIALGAPLLLLSILLASYATLSGEQGRARGLIAQGLTYAGLTASLSAVGLAVLFRLLPHLTPDGGVGFAWTTLVVFLAALPLDPMRLLVVEIVGRRLFANPTGVRDLAEQVERTEVRADHVERLAEIGRLASAVAHEIRNPLGVIAAQAKLLERQGAKPETIASMRAQVDRARHFLDDLLRYSKPRPLDLASIDVMPALRLAATNARQAFGEAAATIDVSGPPVSIEADRGAFNDVATVLAENALIAVEEVPGAGVRMTVRETHGGIELRVEDDGPGVPRELEATLFQPFVTGRGRDARRPGTGLGLAIACRWVERHGGTLRYERGNLGRGGACFIARWPAHGD